MASSGPLLRLTSVSRQFQSTGSTGTVPVLQEIDCTVEAGESIAVVGPSGSGKSTLLHLIGTLDRPSSGQVLLNGRDIGGFNEKELASLRSRMIGFVFQSHFLLPQCTVMENVLVPALALLDNDRTLPADSGTTGQSQPAEDAEGRAKRLLERVGLSARLTHWPGQLSGGERQRVALVRALINRPALLLADEPTGALDQASAYGLGQLLVDLNREEGVTLIVVTHAMDLARRMGRVLQLRAGRLVPAETNA